MNGMFEWSDSYCAGIQEVDEQHKELLIALNEVAAAVREGADTARQRALLDALAENARAHFSLEESLMRVSNYPEFQSHKQLHEELMGQMLGVQERLDLGEECISFELLHFLKVWLINHINEADRRFCVYFLSVGGEAEWAPHVADGMARKGKGWKFW
ncbi:MAG: hemerythrin family protein [Rhodocyclaceae bacterium]|nr:hemerythrin family protein [Rhodocyclaceae bacterium]